MTPYIKIENGDKFYYKDKEMSILHREDGPAVEWSNGGKAWWINGREHRVDGAAIEYAKGSKMWYLNGVQYTEEQFNAIKKHYTEEI